MTKDTLSARQYALAGTGANGRNAFVYISNEVDGLLHMNFCGKEIWVKPNDLLDCIGLLKFGDEYQKSLDRVKEAKHAKR